MHFVFGKVEMSFWVQENAGYDYRKGINRSQILEMDKKALLTFLITNSENKRNKTRKIKYLSFLTFGYILFINGFKPPIPWWLISCNSNPLVGTGSGCNSQFCGRLPNDLSETCDHISKAFASASIVIIV